MNNKVNIIRFLEKQTEEQFIVSPCYSESIAGEYIKSDWRTKQNAPEMINAKLDFAEECGFPPFIKHELGSYDLFTPEAHIESIGDDMEIRSFVYKTPMGDLSSKSTYIRDSGHEDKKLIEDIDDLMKLVWLYENKADFNQLKNQAEKHLEIIGDRGLMVLNIANPLSLITSAEQCIFFSYDDPDKMDDIARRMLVIIKKLIDYAFDAGIKCFFCGCMSRNMFSPEILERWIVPYVARLSHYCQDKGAFFYLHECGNMNTNLKNGYYHQIMPNILEGFEAPPLGDISSISETRKSLPTEIIMKGNLNMKFIEESTTEQIQATTVELMKELGAYKHIIGGACSLLRNTPIENIQAIVKVVDKC